MEENKDDNIEQWMVDNSERPTDSEHAARKKKLFVYLFFFHLNVQCSYININEVELNQN